MRLNFEKPTTQALIDEFLKKSKTVVMIISLSNQELSVFSSGDRESLINRFNKYLPKKTSAHNAKLIMHEENEKRKFLLLCLCCSYN